MCDPAIAPKVIGTVLKSAITFSAVLTALKQQHLPMSKIGAARSKNGL